MFFAVFDSKMGSLRVGRCLKSFLEVLRFVVTEYRAVRSHGDLIPDELTVLDKICYNMPSLLLLWYLGCGVSGGIWGIWEGM